MSDIINRQYKRKGDSSSDTFTVEALEGDFVIFTNGARCKIITLVTDFEEQTSVLPITENTNTTEIEINPDTFFDTPLSTENPLLDQLENVMHGHSVQSERLSQSVDLDVSIPEPQTGLASRMNAQTPTPGHELNLSDTVIPVSPNTSSEVRLPEWDVFDRVKKNDELEVMIPLKIKLPKAQKIDALDDMFDSSFIMYLAKQYIKDYIVTNPITLQKQIQEAIEAWIDKEVYGTPVKTPTTRKRSTVKKTTRAGKTTPGKKPRKKTVAKKVEEPVVATSEDTALNFFNQTQSTWDGDVKALLMINTDEQYQAIKTRYETVLENNPESNDRYRFEDMIEIYEMQVADLKTKETEKTDAKN